MPGELLGYLSAYVELGTWVAVGTALLYSVLALILIVANELGNYMDKQVNWTTVDQQFPAGTVAGGWFISVTNNADGTAQHQTLAADASSAVFALDPGDYTASAQRLDSAGNPLQAEVKSDPFNVPVPSTVTISVANAVTVGDPVVSVAVANAVTAA